MPDAALAELAGPRGFCVVPNWLCTKDVLAVWSDVRACEEAGLARVAGVGSLKHGNRHMNERVRSSSMCPLIPPPPPSVGSIDTRLALSAAVSDLREVLTKSPLLYDLPALAPFRTELSYLCYPVGGFYRRHIDVPAARDGWQPLGRSPEDGGSFSGARTRREVSFLLYLNPGWDPAWGGALRVYPPEGQGAKGPRAQGPKRVYSPEARYGRTPSDEPSEEPSDEPSEEPHVDIAPEGGTLVMMRSDRVPHEVCETRRGRQCVVGWFCTMHTDR